MPRTKTPTKRDRSSKGKHMVEKEEEADLAQDYNAPFPIKTHEKGKRYTSLAST